jgi:3-phenylpropionate/trans-cinnamate dioxygenase ferredoxin reductase component
MTTGTPACVIVGGGHAAAQAALSLRKDGWSGAITVISDDPLLPYHRPPLSKTFLKGDVTELSLLIRPETIYEKASIAFQLNTRVVALDRTNRKILINGGDRTHYDQLILATGSRNRIPPIEGITAIGIHTLRTAADATSIRSAAAEAKRAVILGGGYIGLEVAASLRSLGLEVTVLELAARILSRVTSPEISEFLHQIHGKHGVGIHTGVTVASVTGAPGSWIVHTRDGATYEANLIVIGAGVVPDTRLAEAAGLEINDGVVVDEGCRTSDPNVYAIGDCARQYHPLYGCHVRLESVQNAVDQAKAASAAINGKPVPPRPLPWFWSDQYDLKLQIAGLSTGYTDVVLRRHAGTPHSLSAWYFAKDQLIAADTINEPLSYAVACKIISARATVDHTNIADPSFNLKTLLPAPQRG